MGNRKQSIAIILGLFAVTLFSSSCSTWWHPRWHSYDRKNPNAKHDHYDPYDVKWYKKRWKDGTLWK